MNKFKLFLTIAISFLITETQAQCTDCNNPSSFGSGRYASKVGIDNAANGDYSFSGGLNSLALRDASFAFGEEAEAEGAHSFALGFHVKALEIYSVALGIDDTASGVSAVAIGFNNNASGDGAMTFGTMLQGTGVRSFVIGTGGGGYPAKKLRNAYSETLMIGFNSTKPTIFVSTSPSNPQYNLTGKVGIGNITQPEAKLHIRADEGEQASIFVEPATWGEKASATLYLGTKQHSIQAYNEYGLFFMSAKNYLFPNGKVGIGTSNPVAELDVEGNLRVGAFAKVPGHQKMIFADQDGVLFTDNIPLYDNMGNCFAENDIVTNGHWIKHSEESEGKGIYISRENLIGIGISMPRAAVDVVTEGETHIIAFSSGEEKAGFWAANRVFSYGFEVDDRGTGHISANMNNPVNIMNFHTNGKVSIGDARPQNGTSHRLFIEGGITSEEVVINSLGENREWPDYVFEKEYELMPLNELKEYINEKGHLPDVPTAREVNNNGLNIGELNAVLLEKIEELTLYVLKQQEEIENLKKMIHE